ncbi:MAG: type II secretion system protein GspK [Candidatus Magnetominusculus sp. LBB02]|nr:type II secretion system protein GspK [Candidatus Magnetominusculus sp. LBB02]
MIDNRRGFALIMVLWIMAILIALSLSFSYMAKVAFRSSTTSRELTKAAFIAEAGINRAIVELQYKKAKPDDVDAWQADGLFKSEAFGGGSYIVRIMPATAKIDLNAADEKLIRGLLKTLNVEPDTQDIIVDSIMDWKDEDDLTRLHGAESDYYMSLDEPYKAKNGSFDSVEELLFVRGVTQDIFYGTDTQKGLRELITVYSKSTKININAAPLEVLMSIPDLGEQYAKAIIEYRSQNLFKTNDEIKAVIPGAYQTAINYIDLNEGDVYTIESVGILNNAASGIRAVAAVTSADYKCYYYKTPETYDFQAVKKEGSQPKKDVIKKIK